MKTSEFIAVIIVTLFMSALDGVLTLWGVRLGAINEANPLIAPLLMNNLLGFFAIKLLTPVIVGLGLWIMRNRPRKFIYNLLVVVVVIYIIVIGMHLRWMMSYFL